MVEMKVFAAVWVGPKGAPHIVADTVRRTAQDARIAAGKYWDGGWEGAKRQGWRIRPATISLAEGGSRDRD